MSRRRRLHYVYDVHARALTLGRVLKPGGLLLAAVPGIYRARQRTPRAFDLMSAPVAETA